MNTESAQREREWSWRAIAPSEEEHLAALAQRLRALRAEANMSRAALARAMRRKSTAGLGHIERAERRTRFSTLRRIARVLGPRLGREPADVLVELVRVAGPTLSPERGGFPTDPYLGRRRPFCDPVTGEHIGFIGVPRAG